jgi:hypothetical protein
MGAQGTAVLDFGAFPGSNVAIVDVVAVGVVVSSAIEAWLNPAASADHTDMDHVAAPMKVTGTYLSDGNIRIYGINVNDTIPPLELVLRKGELPVFANRNYVTFERRNAPMFVGQFNVNWVWN